jgi:hypothetical protein
MAYRYYMPFRFFPAHSADTTFECLVEQWQQFLSGIQAQTLQFSWLNQNFRKTIICFGFI